MSFEQLGPTFVKLGQLLSSRPDLIPKEIAEEFKRLQSDVTNLPFEEMEPVLKAHFGKSYGQVFKDFDKKPLAAASISQVYRAILSDGTPVVVKVQKPNIENIIHEDLAVLFTLAELIETYVPEAQVYNPTSIVEEFAKHLDLETNFIVEANNIRRFAKNFVGEEQIVIPKVYSELSGKKVLVLEELQGIPLSHKNALEQEGIDPEKVLKTGLRAYLKMVFTYGLFHGDLHAGNMFVLPQNRIGFIDFGMVGRLTHKTQEAIANILIALSQEDYDRLAYEYIDLAPYSGFVDLDNYARELRDLIAPYYGLTSKNINIGLLLMDATALAASYRIQLPTELIMFFKSIVSIEGMGRIIVNDFDFLNYSIDFASELVKERYEPQKLARNLSIIARDTNSLFTTLPRQIKQLLRRLNSPNFSINVSSEDVYNLKKSVETSSNLLFLGLVIGSLLLSASILNLVESASKVFGLPFLSFMGFAMAAGLSLVAFYNYIKK
ncbi:MAG: AarF/ABC1/UbiB kinase family protein [Bdellovibrionales bacterium]|nr:AarF/ABC1/UbiB kinase family protein [Bdellovibrionales bacterium]